MDIPKTGTLFMHATLEIGEVVRMLSDRRTADVAIVGPGRAMVSQHQPSDVHHEDFHTSLQPFVVAAYLDSADISYRMRIVDIDERTLDAVHSQEHIVMRADDLICDDGDEVCEANQKGFRDYLWHAGFTDSDLRVKTMTASQRLYDETYRERDVKVVCAPIPSSFRHKRTTGDISFSLADIAQMDLRERYDFIVATHVLGHVPAQVAAARRLVSHLRPGGYLLATHFPKDEIPALPVEDRSAQVRLCTGRAGYQVLQRL